MMASFKTVILALFLAGDYTKTPYKLLLILLITKDGLFFYTPDDYMV